MIKPDVEFNVLLPRALADEITHLAREYDVSVGSLTRKALAAFIRNQETPELLPSHTEVPQKDNLHELKSSFETVVHQSSSWDELQSKLLAFGLEMAPRGGGLIIRKADGHDDVCKASELGYGYSALIKKFKAPFPGHSHTWLAERVLCQDNDSVIE